MDELKKAYRLAMMIGVAMIGSLFSYVVLAEFIRTIYRPFRGFSSFQEVEILRYLFFLITIAEFFIIRYARGFILSRKVVTERSIGPKEPFSPIVQRLLTTTIVSYALCESVAIFGLVLFLIGGSSLDIYVFVALSLFYYAVYFPRHGQWEEYISKI